MLRRAHAALGALLLLLSGAAAAAAPTAMVLPRATVSNSPDAAPPIPEHFDSRETFYGCGDTVLNQAECGSCWAVSAASTVSDRFCVHANKEFGAAGATPLALSPQPLVSCASRAVSDTFQSAGCNGGFQEEAWRFLQDSGTAEMSADQVSGCRPYWSGNCAPDPAGDGCLPCAAVNECIDSGLAPTRYSVVGVGAVVGSEHDLGQQVEAVQREIMRNGPVQACFDVYAAFMTFYDDQPMGVFNSTDGTDTVGGHCVKIIGWGVTPVEAMPFWLIANSWGEGWAQKGTFRYIRGADLGGLDTAIWAGCPAGTRCELTPAVKPAAQAPASARRSGGRWHAASQAAVAAAVMAATGAAPQAQHAHLARAVSAVVRHLEASAAGVAGAAARRVALDMRAAKELLASLRRGVASVEGADDDAAAVACAQTQVVAGLRTRLVLRAGAADARRHVVATTLLPARGAARKEHGLESLAVVDAAEADALCFGAATEAVREGQLSSHDVEAEAAPL